MPDIRHPAPDSVLRTRFLPPRLRPRIVARPRVEAALARVVEYPLTVVKAEAGYGKTTAVAAWLASAGLPHAWCNVGDVEPDPGVFLLHLVHALRTLHPALGARTLERLERLERGEQRSPRQWAAVVDALGNDVLDCLTTETVLVLDDYDRVNGAETNAITERLVESMPPLLHLVITARTMPSLRSRARWRASGELLEIARAELAFTTDEVSALFAGRLPRPLSAEDARAVAAETEGWPIALQMLGDSLGSAHPDALDDLLRRIPGPAELLFDYLAEEVFLRQAPETRRFLGESASLRRLDPGACDHALEMRDAADVLRVLEQRSLFVAGDGAGRYHYHNLFADFLRRRSGVTPERRVAIHRRAAGWYAAQGEDEEAVHHLLAAGDHATAAAALGRIAGGMVRDGRHAALGTWLDQLPDETLDGAPGLLVARGETARLASRYTDALRAYARARTRFHALGDAAGETRALKGEALVYLDTVQPARAEPPLREAARRTRGDRAERAALCLLLAENTLNLGDTRRAGRLFRAAHRGAAQGDATGPALDARLLLREGRLAEARLVAEAHRRAEPAVAPRSRAPRSHRETAALLAWIDAMAGDAESARARAEEALEVGRTLGSLTIECVSLSRLGFAWLSGHDWDVARARAHCLDALRVAERLEVPRFRVEPLLGLTIIHGLEGKRDEAEGAAREALAILDAAGDRYLRAITCLALGAALVLADRARGEEWLCEAERLGAACGDRFTPCLAALWLAVHYARTSRPAEARERFARVLTTVRQEGYAFLFAGTTLLAPKDAALWRGLLRRAQEHPELGDYARQLARQLDPPAETAGPGGESPASAPLYIQTLGPFRVWRRGQEIERSAWSREKALHLLQLLVVHRGRVLHREQILETLWGDGTASTASTGLRVALSALRGALSPDRESGADCPFVKREGEVIRLALDAGIRVDADEFARLLKAARQAEAHDPEGAIALYESALALYRGEFLGETRYAAWADAERQQRRGELLASAERLATLLLKGGEWERAARWAETILQHDPLWEAAYAIQMEAHWRQGNRALALRVFKRGQKRLQASLGVGPGGRMMELWRRIGAASS